jgi:hypothetical protein
VLINPFIFFQLIILRAAAISITALFSAACVLSWANYPFGIAAITTVVYCVSYYYLLKEGFRAYRIFVPNDDSAFVEPLLELSSGGGNASGMSQGELVLYRAGDVSARLCCIYIQWG